MSTRIEWWTLKLWRNPTPAARTGSVENPHLISSSDCSILSH